MQQVSHTKKVITQLEENLCLLENERKEMNKEV